MTRTFDEIFTDLQSTPETDTERRDQLTNELSEALPAGEAGERAEAGQPGGVRPEGATIPKV